MPYFSAERRKKMHKHNGDILIKRLEVLRTNKKNAKALYEAECTLARQHHKQRLDRILTSLKQRYESRIEAIARWHDRYREELDKESESMQDAMEELKEEQPNDDSSVSYPGKQKVLTDVGLEEQRQQAKLDNAAPISQEELKRIDKRHKAKRK